MSAGAYNRTAELRALDATFSGVCGLAVSGVTKVPRIFRAVAPDQQHTNPAGQETTSTAAVPVIDLSVADRASVVAAIRSAAAEWGFFQVTTQGVPLESMAAAVGAVPVRGFHESAGGEKARLYSREPARAVKYHCNFDLYQSPVANWRDTLCLRMAPDPPAAADLPDNCRVDLCEYARQVKNLGNTLFELLSEALGLNPRYLTVPAPSLTSPSARPGIRTPGS